MSERAEGAVVWLLAGQALLRSGGIRAVKLRAMAAECGLTTGSFYHHFHSMPEYLEALAGFYGSEQVDEHLSKIQEDDPRERIRLVAEVGRELQLLPVDTAMRDWAGSNPVAATAVAEADARLLRFLAGAFHDLGFEGHEGELRAHLLLASGVARVTPPWGRKPADLDDVLDILAT